MKSIRTLTNGVMRELNVDDHTASLIAETLDEMYPRENGASYWSFKAEGNKYTVEIL